MNLIYPSLLFEKQKVFAVSRSKDQAAFFDLSKEIMPFETLILFNYTQSESLPEAEQQQLDRLLAACQLNKGTYFTLNTAKVPGFIFNELKKCEALRSVLIFGDIPGMSRNAQYLKNKIYQLGEIRWVMAGNLSKLKESPADKMALVPCLESLFNLKFGK